MRISNRGQLTIPRSLRQKYGLAPNTEVELEEADGCIIVRPISSETSNSAETNGVSSQPRAMLGDDPVAEAPAKPRKRNPKLAALKYVAKMDLPADHKRLMEEAADRFCAKSFLPTIGDIRNFCEIYQIALPKSGSRASAIPRVFRFLAAMDTGELQTMLDNGSFSGPARLGLVSEAIMRARDARIRERNQIKTRPSESGFISATVNIDRRDHKESQTMKTYKLPYVIYPPSQSTEPDKYMAEIPILPGCRAWGDTPAETVDILQSVAAAFIEIDIERGWDLPEEVQAALVKPDVSELMASAPPHPRK